MRQVFYDAYKKAAGAAFCLLICSPLSDHVIIGEMLVGLVDYILQGYAEEIIVDDLVKSLPDREGGAVNAPFAVDRVVRTHAGNG